MKQWQGEAVSVYPNIMANQEATLMVDSTTALLVAQYCRIPAQRIRTLVLQSGTRLADDNHIPARIPVAAANAIWCEAIAISRDPLLPFRCAQLVPPGAFRTVDMLLLYSPTLLDGLENCRRIFGLVNEAFEFDLQRKEDHVSVSLFALLDEDLMPEAYSEYVLLLLLMRCQISRRGRGVPLLELHLRDNSEIKIEVYEKEFRCRVRLQQPVHRLIFPVEPLIAPQPFADAGLTEVLMQYAARLLQERQQELPLVLQLVVQVLEKNLTQGGSKLSTISRKLAMSERTLQRALRFYGTTLRALHDDVRKRKFHSLIAQGQRNLDELSYALGFDDIRSFYRRVRVWTGTSPADYLKRISHEGELNG